MGRAPPPMAWFRSFDAAARHLSFTAAASELGITQSAVSQQIRALETRFGMPLFHRRPRGLALTDAGRQLMPEVHGALTALADISNRFDTGTGEELLTVATSVSFAQLYLARGIGPFLTENPGLRIRVLGAIWPDDFQGSPADVEIRFGSSGVVGTKAERLEPDELIAVAAPDLTVRRNNLADNTLIEAVGVTEGWRKWGEQIDETHSLRGTLFVDSYGMAVDLARSGAGIALTSSLIAAPWLADGTLRQVHPAKLRGSEGYFLAVSPSAGAPAHALADWLKTLVADPGRLSAVRGR